MSKKTALLVNDTANTYHWGCYGTSTEIRLSLEECGYSVQSISAVEIVELKAAPRTDAEAQDKGFRSAFLKQNPTIEKALSESDCVVVNGEGTLHGAGKAAFNLLYIANLAKTTFHKPVYAINMSLFPDDSGQANNAADAFYKSMLEPLDEIVLREPRSLEVAKRIGLDAREGFDCLPRFLARQGNDQESHKAGPIVLGGGLGIDFESYANLAQEIVQTINPTPVVYLIGAQSHPALDDIKTRQVLTEAVPNINVLTARTFKEWSNAIAQASCVVSGRFHHSIAALCLGTPIVVFHARTPKIAGLCEKLSLDPPLSITDPNQTETALNQIKAALETHNRPIDEQAIQSLRDSAAHNFDGL